MELFTRDEIEHILKQCGFTVHDGFEWDIENYSSEVIGYLGEHLRLTIQFNGEGVNTKLNLFVKCMPRFNKWKADYLRETSFFKKEFVMLNGLFRHFQNGQGERKWRPNLLYIKEELFAFEDVSLMGYAMANHTLTLADDELLASVETMARFHAQSYIYEETKSKELGRPYRIWEEYGECLTEPVNVRSWRDTGKRAAIDYLKQYSAYRLNLGFNENIDVIFTMLFEQALDLMKPTDTYRNVVIHRDLWTNNIFLKKLETGKLHALFVDYQTVLYTSPMLDLSSLLFFNTTKNFRSTQTDNVIELYYATLAVELQCNDIDVLTVTDKNELKSAYEDSLVFGLTQAALIVPLAAMSTERKRQLFVNHETAMQLDVISRSEEIIETAREDHSYQIRVTELLDDIVERYLPFG